MILCIVIGFITQYPHWLFNWGEVESYAQAGSCTFGRLFGRLLAWLSTFSLVVLEWLYYQGYSTTSFCAGRKNLRRWSPHGFMVLGLLG